LWLAFSGHACYACFLVLGLSLTWLLIISANDDGEEEEEEEVTMN
jgi:hypothetical protein